MNDKEALDQCAEEDLAILREVVELRQRRFNQLYTGPDSREDVSLNTREDRSYSIHIAGAEIGGTTKNEKRYDEANMLAILREVNDSRIERLMQTCAPPNQTPPGGVSHDQLAWKVNPPEVMHTSVDISHSLLKAALSKNAENALRALSHIAALPASDAVVHHLSAHPISLLKTAASFPARADIVERTLAIIQHIMKIDKCDHVVITSRKYIRLYAHLLSIHSRDGAICTQLCTLLSDAVAACVSRNTNEEACKELTDSGLAITLVNVLNPRGDKAMSPEVGRLVLELVLHLVASAPMLLPSFLDAGMGDTLSRHAMKYRGDAFESAIGSAVRAIRASAVDTDDDEGEGLEGGGL